MSRAVDIDYNRLVRIIEKRQAKWVNEPWDYKSADDFPVCSFCAK
jgi:hypothetical protein